MSWSKRHHLKLKKLNGGGGRPIDAIAPFSGSWFKGRIWGWWWPCTGLWPGKPGLLSIHEVLAILCVCPAQCLHQDSCPHRGYVPLRFCQKTKFLNGGSAKNRIRFGLKLGCHSIPLSASQHSLRRKCRAILCLLLNEKKNTDSRKHNFICFSRLLIFSCRLECFACANQEVLNYLSGAVGSCICKYFD